MSQLITLALPNFSEPFDLTTDASGVAIGAVLSQRDKPISFFSKKLCDRMQGNSTYIHELYAITEAIKKWRQYLLGQQHKWLTKLLEYDFEVYYKPGKENRVADALSRPEPSTLMAISNPKATWLDDLRTYYRENPEGQKLIEQLEQKSDSLPQHTQHDGLVYFQGRLFIPNIPHLRLLLLQEFHTSTLGGHSGMQATFRRMLPSFYWPTLKQDVHEFIKKYKNFSSI
nr:Ty3/gypsy retrotransposon protein [Tanacetum cinerariifolium]